MIIFLSELQKEHLSFLHEHSVQVLVDFCKLAIDYLNNGINQNLNSIAADKLNISTLSVQDIIHAIVYLVVEGCKHNLPESDFKASLALAGFSSDKQEVLVRLYNSKRVELAEALCLLQQKDPTYQDLLWRFEVQIASKDGSQQIKPTIAMDFVLMSPKNYGQKSLEDYNDKQFKNLKVSTINSTIQDSKAASHCQNIISHVLLECDLPNLAHLTNKLDLALKESKSQHVRKVQRAFQ